MVTLIAAACGDRDDRLDNWVGFDGPYVAGDRVVYLDRTFDELLTLTVEKNDTSPAWDRTPVQAGTTVLAQIPQLDCLLLRNLDAGTIDALYPESGKTQSFEVTSPYDRVTVSPAASVVAMYYSENAQGTDDALLVNKGEISFLDLATDKGTLTTRVLPTYGGAPLGVDVAPAVDLGGKKRQLAFVRWNSFISIVEIGKEGIAPIKVPLKPPDSEIPVYPAPIQFMLDGAMLRAFFLAAGTQDLYMLEVDVAKLKAGGAGVSINVFPTASGAVSFTPFVAADGTLTIAVPCSSARKVAIVRPVSSEVILYSVDIFPQAVRVFKLPDSDLQAAFVYNSAGSDNSYYFVELDALKEKKSKAFHFYSLPSAINRVYLLGDLQNFLVFHSSGASPMSIVSAADGSVVSLGGGDLVITNEIFSKDLNRMFALAGKSGTTYAVAYDFTDVGQLSGRYLDLAGQSVPKGLSFLQDKELLVVPGDEGRSLIVLPTSFKDRGEAVEIVAPFLVGLEH
jgi:hypothetical protein